MTQREDIMTRRKPGAQFFSRIRRNHGLEHATLNILSKHYPKNNLAGHSDAGGFWLIGDVEIEDVYEAVEEARSRLNGGEKNLAIHRNCGTNFVTSGVLAGLAAGAAMFGAGRRTRDKLERLPISMLLATLVLILSQPLGFFIQERVTTSPELGELQVVEIVASRKGGMKAHRVVTRY